MSTLTVTPDTAIERIAALLRQAESTDNEHEAEAFMTAAQRLSTLQAIDLERARAYVPKGQRREVPTQKGVRIGERGKKGLATFCNLFMDIGRANDLKFTIAQDSTYVYAFGMPSDIEMTELLYGSLVVQMVEASNAYIKSGEYKSETIFDHRTWERKPVHGHTARISFQQAFASQVGRRLMEARSAAVAEAEATEQANPGYEPSEGSVAMVLKSKTTEVGDYYKMTNNARGSWKGGSSNSHSSSAYGAGSRAGAAARLSAPKGIAGSRGSLR